MALLQKGKGKKHKTDTKKDSQVNKVAIHTISIVDRNELQGKFWKETVLYLQKKLFIVEGVSKLSVVEEEDSVE